MRRLALDALAETRHAPFWLERPGAPERRPPLAGDGRCDLAIVGAGFTGLWAAILAKEADPGRDVAVLEAERVAFGGSGRNGGFVDASLTHGLANGIQRFPDEIGRLEELGRENLAGLEAALERYGIDADYEAVGVVDVAREPYEEEELTAYAEELRRFGWDAEYLDRERMRAEVGSPTYLGGLWRRDGAALVDPARLAWGLARAALELGVHLHEGTPVRAIRETASGVELATPQGVLAARRAVLATNGFPPLVRAIRRYVVPVYDYVLVTEPLSEAQWRSIGWRNRQGLADSANLFHYYRPTADGRILWGGYDAIYHFGNAVRPELEHRPATFATLATHFFETFPQLEGLRFSHRWAGVIDTCSRFCVMFGRACSGKAVYAVGYTGLGVAATRFGARVALDLVNGVRSELTRLELVRSKPIPFPPEPLRWLAIELTRRELMRADRNGGRRGLWLRALDRLGVGFDS